MCGDPLKVLLSSWYCPRECDKPKTIASAAVPAIGTLPQIAAWVNHPMTVHENINGRLYKVVPMNSLMKFYLHNNEKSKWSDYTWKRIGVSNTEADFQRYNFTTGKLIAGSMAGQGNIDSATLPYFAYLL